MRDIHMPMNGVYFKQVVAGEKPLEFRLITTRWIKILCDTSVLEQSEVDKTLYRLRDSKWLPLEKLYKSLSQRKYKNIHFKLGYPRADDLSRIHTIPYRGFEVQTITHPHFGSEPVEVFAIYTE